MLAIALRRALVTLPATPVRQHLPPAFTAWRCTLLDVPIPRNISRRYACRQAPGKWYGHSSRARSHVCAAWPCDGPSRPARLGRPRPAGCAHHSGSVSAPECRCGHLAMLAPGAGTPAVRGARCCPDSTPTLPFWRRRPEAPRAGYLATMPRRLHSLALGVFRTSWVKSKPGFFSQKKNKARRRRTAPGHPRGTIFWCLWFRMS